MLYAHARKRFELPARKVPVPGQDRGPHAIGLVSDAGPESAEGRGPQLTAVTAVSLCPPPAASSCGCAALKLTLPNLPFCACLSVRSMHSISQGVPVPND